MKLKEGAMAHLGERVADYLIGEMTDSEMAEASEHIRQCSDCSGQVDAFKRTLAMLQSVPDREPPRPLVFEVEQRKQARSWLWGWASPAFAAVAASILTAVLMSPGGVESPNTAQSWLAELDKRDQAHSQDLLRLRTELALLERQQKLSSRDTLDTARSIQLLAQKLPSGD
jgi:anti-sigma factor RsiW